MPSVATIARRAALPLVCLSLMSLDSHAADETMARSPHHKGLLSSVNLGVRYSSLLEHRGVINYRDFQIDPVLGVFLFDDRLEFLGDSISYRDFVAGRWLRLRSKISAISDDPLFPAHESVKAASPNRTDSYEWSLRAEFFIPDYDEGYLGEISIGYSKDLVAHLGHYLEVQGKAKVVRFRLPVVGTLMEPNAFVSVGWGSSQHNRYVYGESQGGSGLNNLTYGLWVAFPEEADRNYPIIQVRHFQALGDFRDSSLAKDRSDGWLISVIATAGLLN
jgi:hypothetical protein